MIRALLTHLGRWLNVPSPARAAQATAIVAALVIVAVVAVVLTGLLTPRAPGITEAVPIPAVGEVAAVKLADGRPVFVVHHETGEISVLDGFSTHVPYGVHKMLAWCPEARIFEDIVHGSKYDEWGVVREGPAPVGMTAISWQMGASGFLRVAGPLDPVPGRATNAPPVNWNACTRTWHDFPADLRFTPAQAVTQPEGSWVLVAGRVDPELRQLCDLGPGCAAPTEIDGLVLEPVLTQRDIDYLTTPRLWLARVTDGRLDHLTWVPDSDAR